MKPFVLKVLGPTYSFEITDQLVDLSPDDGSVPTRSEVALSDAVLTGHGVDPVVFRADVRAGEVVLEVVSVPPEGLEDGPAFYQMYLSQSGLPSGCVEYLAQSTNGMFLEVGDGSASWWNNHFLAPGSFDLYGFEESGLAYCYGWADATHWINYQVNSGCEFDHGNPTADPLPLTPSIPDDVVSVYVQIRFPDNLPLPPTRCTAQVRTLSVDLTSEQGMDSVGDFEVRDDGSYLLEMGLVSGSSMELLVASFNNPTGHYPIEGDIYYVSPPTITVEFGWTDEFGVVDLTTPYTEAGIWFCTGTDVPPETELGVPPVRQYPRDDQYGLGSAPRLHPPPRRRRVVGGLQ